MSREFYPFQNVAVKVSYLETSPDSAAIFPRLRIAFDISFLPRDPIYKTIRLSNFVFSLYLQEDGREYFIGNLLAEYSLIVLYPQSSNRLNTLLDLDFHRLDQIEKLRKGGNITFRITANLVIELETDRPQPRQMCTFDIAPIKIPKSVWIEDILSKIGYKEASLIEIPKLNSAEYVKVVEWINSAWKQYMGGEYDKVLGDCRKAIEGLTEIVKSKGFEKTIMDNGKERRVPDWNRFFNNENLGDVFSSIVQKILGFTAIGTHYGKGINREDANLALMTVHAVAHFIIKKASS